jgi:hypothetical protein
MSNYNNNSPRGNGARAAVAGRRLEPTPSVREKVKMGFFRRKFMEWCKHAWDEQYATKGLVRADDYVDSEPQLNFKIYSATGGHIMEFRRYDRKTDRSDNQLYVINADDDMGERVARIVNMEMMK